MLTAAPNGGWAEPSGGMALGWAAAIKSSGEPVRDRDAGRCSPDRGRMPYWGFRMVRCFPPALPEGAVKVAACSRQSRSSPLGA